MKYCKKLNIILIFLGFSIDVTIVENCRAAMSNPFKAFRYEKIRKEILKDD